MANWSVALLSEATAADRLDAEYFYPADRSLIHALKKAGGRSLGEICEVLNGRTPEDYYSDGDIPIVRSGDLVAPLIYPSCERPFLRTMNSANLVKLVNGDVLISSIGMGSIGKISLVMDAGNFSTVSEVTILRTKSYPPEILFAYLRTPAGQRQIAREITGATGQQHLLKSKVEAIIVPSVPSLKVCKDIKAACQRGWKLEMEEVAPFVCTAARGF